jgi:hypothetical protein
MGTGVRDREKVGVVVLSAKSGVVISLAVDHDALV